MPCLSAVGILFQVTLYLILLGIVDGFRVHVSGRMILDSHQGPLPVHTRSPVALRGVLVLGFIADVRLVDLHRSLQKPAFTNR